MPKEQQPSFNNIFTIGPDGGTYDHYMGEYRLKLNGWYSAPKYRYPKWVDTDEKRAQWREYWDHQVEWWVSEIRQNRRNNTWRGNGRPG